MYHANVWIWAETWYLLVILACCSPRPGCPPLADASRPRTAHMFRIYSSVCCLYEILPRLPLPLARG